MIDLNNKRAIVAIDTKNVYASVTQLAKQCRQALEETQNIAFPTEYKNVKNIVLCGMGGSAYAAYFIKALFAKTLSVPLELVNGYDLPEYVNENTLVLLSSYSGTTEEVLSCAHQAMTRNAKVAVVASGSKLAEFAKEHNFPAYLFNPLYNPSDQPRLGQGYMILGHIGLLAKIGFIRLSSDENMDEGIDFLETNTNNIEAIAKSMVERFVEKIPVIVAGEHLSGNAHALRNQFNETAKSFSTYALLSELNHHLMEGLTRPTQKILLFLFLNSQLYSQVMQKRFTLTKEVIKKNGVEILDVDILGETPFEQMLYALSFGGYLTFYLAILYKQDPSLIPWVDYFKEQLAK